MRENKENKTNLQEIYLNINLFKQNIINSEKIYKKRFHSKL